MECEPTAEPPGPTLPAPTGWWPEPDTIAWVGRASDDPEDDPEATPETEPDDEPETGPDDGGG